MSELHTKFSVHVACGRGSVLFWRYCDILYISGVVNDVMFAHNGQAYAMRRIRDMLKTTHQRAARIQ